MALPVTGERTVPGLPHENYWFRRHEAAYVALAPRCADARVLEAGCGEGYGAAAAQVAGVTWTEVERGSVRPLTPDEVLARLARHGDLLAPLLPPDS